MKITTPKKRPIRALVADGAIRPSDRVVLFNTGGALKYLDALPSS
jgi:hypothetical protein